MEMHTKIRRNGAPNQYEVVWSLPMKVGVGALTGLLILGVASTIGMYGQMKVLATEVHHLGEALKEHVGGDIHEDGERKRERIKSIVLEELRHHEKQEHNR